MGTTLVDNSIILSLLYVHGRGLFYIYITYDFIKVDYLFFVLFKYATQKYNCLVLDDMVVTTAATTNSLLPSNGRRICGGVTVQQQQ